MVRIDWPLLSQDQRVRASDAAALITTKLKIDPVVYLTAEEIFEELFPRTTRSTSTVLTVDDFSAVLCIGPIRTTVVLQNHGFTFQNSKCQSDQWTFEGRTWRAKRIGNSRGDRHQPDPKTGQMPDMTELQEAVKMQVMSLTHQCLTNNISQQPETASLSISSEHHQIKRSSPPATTCRSTAIPLWQQSITSSRPKPMHT